MMEWEAPLAAAHADVCVGAFPHDVCSPEGSDDLRVLNGPRFGHRRRFLRNYSSRIAAHCVIEPHPDVEAVDAQRRSGRRYF